MGKEVRKKKTIVKVSKEPVVHDLDAELDKLEKKESSVFGKKILFYFQDRWKSFQQYIKRKKEERLTIMFIPHDERSIRNFHVSNLTLTIILSSLVLVLFLSSMLVINHNSTVLKVDKMKLSQQDAKLQFARIRQEIKMMGDTFSELRGSVVELYTLIEGKEKADALFAQGGADIAESLEVPEEKNNPEEIPLEVFLLNRILNDLEISEKPLGDLDPYLKKREKVIKNTPTLWPVSGSIANTWGQTRSANSLRLIYNRGVDIATFPGAEVIAAAPGVVTSVVRTGNYEWLVKVRHNYGYETYYRGIDRVSVSKGEKVIKGEVLGYMGLATSQAETILHYEIHIGTDAVNPAPYLSFLQH